MCFNNGGESGFLQAVAISEDGVCLGSHICSTEAYMPHDLGVLEGTRLDRHENDYRKHYPEGYIMEFIPSNAIKDHEKLNVAFTLNDKQRKEAEVAK
jgi:hypothetical protein